MNLMDLFVKISVDDQASSQVETIGSKLKGGLATAAKVGAAAVAAAGTAVVAIGKQAIDQYAEYEQLVGGAELMFGDAYDFVAEKAKNAYSTVQMSQNDYLRQVNGFATGLKTALGGNAKAAAELADKIVNAEADVVAATGASQEMVQNAFNGIMRSNYVMLDNLQLGITPTKEGFQEVIDKVNEWNAANGEATNYVIDNLADAQSALVDYIEMQGLQGYAANEAADTIQGSVDSMKSAWSNLVTGISDDNADLDVLVGNFVDSAVTAAGNIVPRIETVLSGIGMFGEKIAPLIGEGISAAVEKAPEFLTAAENMLTSIASGIIDALPSLLDSAVEIVNTLASGISENLPQLIPNIVDVVIQIVETLIDNVDMLIDAAIEIIVALADGLVNSLPTLIEEIPGLVIKIVEAIIENAPKLLDAATEIIAKLISGLIEGFVGISIEIGGWLYDNIVQPIIDKVSDLKDAGKQLLEGLWNGISDKVEWLKGKVSGVIDTIKGWFTGKDGFDEHSPSKWSKQVFRYVMEGGGEGLDSGLPGLMRSVGSVTDRVKSGLDFGTASVDFASSGIGRVTRRNENSFADLQPITIVVQSVLDGKVIGETATKYNRKMQRAMGV